MYLRQYALTFLVAFGLAALLTPLAGHLGHRLGIVDRPGGRRGHRGEIPRLGGIAIFLAFVVAVGVGRSLYIPTADEKEPLRLLGLLAGSAFLSLVGLVDDRWELRPLPQFVAQMIAAVIAIATLIIVERFNNPLTNEMVILPPIYYCLLYTSPSPRDISGSRMPSSA